MTLRAYQDQCILLRVQWKNRRSAQRRLRLAKEAYLLALKKVRNASAMLESDSYAAFSAYRYCSECGDALHRAQSGLLHESLVFRSLLRDARLALREAQDARLLLGEK